MTTPSPAELKCPKHPTYQVKRAPRGACLQCRVLWLEKQLARAERRLEALETQTREMWAWP